MAGVRGWLRALGLGLATLAVLLPLPAAGVVFSECELVQQLRDHSFPEDQLPDWVCLVENESRGNTSVVAGPNTDGSYDHGLFQINDMYWCSNGSPGGGCNVQCEDLTTDDITAASQCAMQIYQVRQFESWTGWVNHCKGQTLPDISGC